MIYTYSDYSFHDYGRAVLEEIRGIIRGKGKDYILRVNKEEFKEYLLDKYLFIPIVVDPTPMIGEPENITREYESRLHREMVRRNGYKIPVTYKYAGTANLWRCAPSSRTLTGAEIELGSGTVTYYVELFEKDPKKFEQEKNSIYGKMIVNLPNLNREVEQWNAQLEGFISSCIQAEYNKYLEENSFFEAISVKVNQNTNTVFTAPTVRKKEVPLPVPEKKEFKSEPSMDSIMYADVLKVLNEVGKSFERKPSTYEGKDEPEIRDSLLLFLETRYEGTTATGETFNKAGKTDILLKYKDGTNLFVAECKKWKGAKEFGEAIDQLLGYLTWRDSKTALIVFVENKNMSDVVTNAVAAVEQHSSFGRKIKQTNDSSFSFELKLPGDGKPIAMELLLFHFPK